MKKGFVIFVASILSFLATFSYYSFLQRTLRFQNRLRKKTSRRNMFGRFRGGQTTKWLSSCFLSTRVETRYAFRRGLCAAATMPAQDVGVLATIAIHKGAYRLLRRITRDVSRRERSAGTECALEACQERACIAGRDDKSLLRTEKVGVD